MTNYSDKYSAIFDKKDRLRVAKQILAVLQSRLENTKKLKCLDYGCSGGDIANFLSPHFDLVYGVDTDTAAIERAKKKYKRRNLYFYLSQREKTDFKSNYFDVVISNQVYEFVEDQQSFAAELYRILKVGGVVLLGARNKYALLEGQTHLPLIHWFSPTITSLLAQACGRDYYPATYLSLLELKKLFDKFQVTDLTQLILKNPEDFGFLSLKKYRWITRNIPQPVWEILKYFIPNYIFLCRK